MANPDPIPLFKRPQIAELLGVSDRAVKLWEVQGLPVAQPGKPGRSSLFDGPAVVAWYVAREVHRATGAVDGGLNPAREAARKNKARADLDEQQYAVRDGALIPRSDFQRVLGRVVTEIKARLMAAPRAWAVELAKVALGGPSAVEAFLTARIRQSLESLARIDVGEEASTRAKS